jgi:hypothetical protein
MGKTGVFILLLGVICVFSFAFSGPLTSLLCAAQSNGILEFLCTYVGGALATLVTFVFLLPLGAILIIVGLVLSILPW